MGRALKWARRRWPWLAALAALGALAALSVVIAVAQEPKKPTEPATPAVPEVTGEPVMWGPFRLVPYGYTKLLNHEKTSWTASGGELTMTRYPDIVKASSLYVEPRGIPANYTLTGYYGDGEGNAELTVGLTFESPVGSIMIVRSRLHETPWDVQLGPPDSFQTIRTGMVGDSPAVFTYPAPGETDPLPVSVTFIQGDVMTFLESHGVDRKNLSLPLEKLIKIAESIEQAPGG